MTRTQSQVMIEFMKTMKEAQGIASQMIVIWRDPRWNVIRETLFNVHNYCINQTVAKEAFGK